MSLPNFLHAVAGAYGRLQHEPDSPAVIRAYASLTGELWQQYQALLASGLSITFTPADPYPDSRALFAAMDARTLQVYTCAELPARHPFAYSAPNGHTFNSIFRAVHDAIAHYPARNGFSMRGEFAAFHAHARTLTPASVNALATETLGQNATYHYGPNARTFAPQRAAILPYALIRCALSLEY